MKEIARIGLMAAFIGMDLASGPDFSPRWTPSSPAPKTPKLTKHRAKVKAARKQNRSRK